jgi:membrane protein involved in colicin uptake
LSAYQVWLEEGNVGTEDDYFAYLRQPATDAAESLSELEQTVSGNEAERVTAEQGRSDAELLRVGAEGIRNSNETDRINAEGIRDANETARINAERDRVDAEDLRKQAEAAREEAEGLRQTNTATAIQNAEDATTAANTAAGLANNAATAANTAAGDANDAAEAANTAAGLANNAATTANTAAQNADDARLAIQDDLALKADQADLEETTEKPTAQSLSELNARITALEAILTNKIKDRIDITKEFNVWGKTNLILIGSGAATFAPDFIGQKYIDTTGGNVYIAVGTSNAGNWKLV